MQYVAQHMKTTCSCYFYLLFKALCAAQFSATHPDLWSTCLSKRCLNFISAWRYDIVEPFLHGKPVINALLSLNAISISAVSWIILANVRIFTRRCWKRFIERLRGLAKSNLRSSAFPVFFLNISQKRSSIGREKKKAKRQRLLKGAKRKRKPPLQGKRIQVSTKDVPYYSCCMLTFSYYSQRKPLLQNVFISLKPI